ncbi:MAG TPA: ATP-binding protein [Terriglobales bacterium]|jgi:two-component system cell cycle sensor histidine kinase/response regulator CckA|nr:ATP-binding protein [Terriglobales bacterium]
MNALAQIQPKLESAEATAEQLGNAQKMEAIGRLVSGVAHDFNNLLTGVVLCSDLLLAGLEKRSRLRRYAQEIRMAAGHGTKLIQQLLAVAREDTVAASLLSLNEAIAGLRYLLERLIGEDIELVTNLADDLAMVKIDPAHSQQIIMNLLLNARDAMPDGGRITLITRNYRPAVTDLGPESTSLTYVEFEVSDSGCGMDEETRARAFQPFFTTKKPGAGSGLGLATVSSIVKECGGTVVVQSAPGKGTRVIVRLPSQFIPPTLKEVGGKFGPAPAPDPQTQRQGKQV